MKKILYAFLIFLLIGNVASAAQPYQSISDIKSSSPARWTESYQTSWREVLIDVPIRVPDVMRFPVIRVTMAQPVDQKHLSMYQFIGRNQNGIFEANYHGEDMVPRDWKIKHSDVFSDGAAPDTLPENSSLAYNDALNFLFDEFQQLFHLTREELSIRKITVDGCFYCFTGSGNKLVWKERASQTGRYVFTFNQLFAGIPYQPALECYHPRHYRIGSEKNIKEGTIFARISDKEEFRIVSKLMQQVDCVYPDVPLLPFHQAKAAFEKEIMAGHLRSVDRLELCYIPYTDPKDEKIFWLLPAWYLKGGYTRDFEREFVPFLDETTGAVIDDGIERAELVFQAQLGSLLQYADKRPERRALPKVITWQETK